MTLFFHLILALVLNPVGAAARPRLSTPPPADWKYVEKRLKKENFSKKFIKALEDTYDDSAFAEVLELNTLLFLKKSDYHGAQINDEAAEDVRKFLAANEKHFDIAEERYHVDREVIASLMWMESRYGKNLGQFHVPSVFVDLVQCDREPVLLYLHKAGKRFTKRVTLQNRKDIDMRAHKRVTWALSELHAIEKMYKKNHKVMDDFPGSFAGAFGMPQFEPSSYAHYAKAEVQNHPPKLDTAEDAIQSVAYYLHKSGWKSNRQKTFVKALMRYNNSHDYANAILKLAAQASTKERAPAGRKSKKKHKQKPKTSVQN